MNKLIALVVVAICAAACGGSSVAAPTEVIASSNITSTGNLTMLSCIDNRCTSFEFHVINSGPGCASAVDLAGTITLTKSGGTTSTANWTLTSGEKATGVFRPGQTKLATSDSGSLIDSSGPGSYSIAITKRTDVKCP